MEEGEVGKGKAQENGPGGWRAERFVVSQEQIIERGAGKAQGRRRKGAGTA